MMKGGIAGLMKQAQQMQDNMKKMQDSLGDVKESVSRAQALIEPMLTLFMGALLGWIMLSVIGPIYDIISKIKT